VRVVVAVHGEGQLLEVTLAFGPPRRFACRLDRRQQQRDEHANDGDHNQKLNQRETM
jgi:hypothetical protein